jgi:hypothetical protein
VLRDLQVHIKYRSRHIRRIAMPHTPQLRVSSIRKVYDDGDHNAFTDMCRFRGRIYLTCRSCPGGHMLFDSSRIIVLSSEDGSRWEAVHSFSVPGRDTRDPHFLVFGERLLVYTGTWLVPSEGQERDLNDHLGFAAHTGDGTAWTSPVMLEGTYGHYIWRAAAHGDRAYLCGRRRREFAARIPGETDTQLIQGAMLTSDDGLIWRHHALFTEEHGNETAFLFQPDGAVLALARGTSEVAARLCLAKPPFDRWERVELQRNVGGPMLASWGKHYLVGGRRTLGDQPRTVLSWIVDDTLVDCAELPSDGDNSYPGFVEVSPTRALLSYYSSHEGSTSIYLAQLDLD